MALYSAWDWDRNAYRVYRTKQLVSIGDDPDPPKPKLRHPIGAVPDVDAKRLPTGARFVGYSHLPRGEIVRLPGARGGLGQVELGLVPSWVPVGIALAIGVALGAWWSSSSRRRRR